MDKQQKLEVAWKVWQASYNAALRGGLPRIFAANSADYARDMFIKMFDA